MSLTLAPAAYVLWRAPGVYGTAEHTVAIGGDYLPAALDDEITPDCWARQAADLRPYFADADLTIINLECPLDCHDLPATRKYGLGFNLTETPATLDYIHAIGARVVSLANNHLFDYGHDGAVRTQTYLRDRGMVPLGYQTTASAPPETFVWRSDDGITIGCWAASCYGRKATAKRPGVEHATPARARAALAALRRQGATCCIALLHAGVEGTNRPDPVDVAVIRTIASQGFDVVAASHAHRISGHEVLHADGVPAFCFYGLGSIISSSLHAPEDHEGLVVQLGINALGRLASVTVRPILLTAAGWGTIPQDEDAQAILHRFHSLSREIRSGSYKRLFYQDHTRAMLARQWHDFTAAIHKGGLAGLCSKFTRLRWRHLARLLRL